MKKLALAQELKENAYPGHGIRMNIKEFINYFF